MSDKVGTPKEDIKKYDFSFATETPSISTANAVAPSQNINDSLEGLNKGTDKTSQELFGGGFSDEQKSDIDKYNKAVRAEENKEDKDYGMGYGEATGRSLLAGLGDVFDGFGDSLDWIDGTPDTRLVESEVSKELYGIDVNKPIADWMHQMGADLQKFGDSVPGLEKIEDVSWSSMMSADFWTTHWARALPFTLTFFIPGAGGARAAGMLYKGGKMLKTGFSAGKMLSKTGLVTAIKGSKIAKGATQFIGGAAAGNMSEGAIIAGQTLNDAIEQGVPLPQASIAAADVFTDNLWWMAVDGLQLAMFTGTAKALNPFTKSVKAMKAPGMKRLVQQMAKVSGYALTDGVFEQFQEVYQDWSMKKRIAEQKGEGFMDYLDYFNSQEALPTRVIAFTSSLAITGAKTSLDVSAERKRLFTEKLAKDGLVQERLEIMNQELEDYDLEGKKGTPEDRLTAVKASDELAAMQNNQLFALMIRTVAEGKAENFTEYIQNRMDEGAMPQRQFDIYANTVKELEAIKALAPTFLLNGEEESYLLHALFEKEQNTKTYKEQLERLEGEKVKIEESDISVAYKKKQLAGLDNELTNLKEVWNQVKQASKLKVDDIMSDNANRRQEERINKEVVPELRKIITKESNNEVLTAKETKLVEENKSRFDTLKSEIRLKDATKKVGSKFKKVTNTVKDNTDLVFQRELKSKGKFRTYQEKRVDANGVVTTTKTTELDIIKTSNEYQESRENKELKIEDIVVKQNNGDQISNEEKELLKVEKVLHEKIKAKKTKELEAEEAAKLKEKEEETDEQKEKSKEEVERNAAQKIIDDSKAKLFFGRAPRFYDPKTGKLTTATKITMGQRYQWAQALMEENPDVGVYFDNNLTDEHGRGTVGAAIGLSIFINPDLATQEVFVHEKWHVYQQLFAGSKEMTALLKEIVNQPIYRQIKNQHHVKILYSKNGSNTSLGSILQDNPSILSWNNWTKENGFTNAPNPSVYSSYMAYLAPLLSELGYAQLADNQQSDIQNEALATAGGFQEANDSTYFTQSKRETRFQKGLRSAWSMISTMLSKEASTEIIRSNFPSLYNEDFSIMLENAREEFSKPNKERNYEAFKRVDGVFYLQNVDRSFAKSSLEQAMLANLPTIDSQVNAVLNRFTNTKGGMPEDMDMRSMINDLFSNRNTLMPTLLDHSKYGLEKSQKDIIDKYYNSSASEVDNLLGGFYFQQLQEKVSERYEAGTINEEMYEELEATTDVAFGKIISEDFSRKVSGRVSKLVGQFLDEHNKNKTGKEIKNKSFLYEALEQQLRGTKNDFYLFEENVETIMTNSRASLIEGVDKITKEELLAEFIIYAQLEMAHPGDALHSMWHYFRSFTLEVGSQWTVAADGKVSLVSSIPIGSARDVKNYVNGNMELLADGENFNDNIIIVSILELIRNESTREKGIVNFVQKFYGEWTDKAMSYGDIADMRIEGKRLKNFFTEEKISELQGALLNIDWSYYYKKGVRTEKYEYLQGEKGQIQYILNSNKDISGNIVLKAGLRQALLDDFIRWQNLEESEQVETKSKNSIVYNSGKSFLRSYKDNFYSTFKSLYTNLYNATYYHAGKTALSGITKNAAGDTVDLFTKSSNIHNNLDNLLRILPNMSNERFNKLFGGNVIARMIKMGYVPKVSTSLGVYNEGESKGKKNSQVKARVLTNVRMMHLIDSILSNSEYYSHFVGQLGDSSRQYYINNAPIWEDSVLDTAFDFTQKMVNKPMNATNVANQLLNQLVEDGHIENKESEKVFQAVLKAVKLNYVNKYNFSDLYYNRAYAQTAYDVSGSKVERLVTDLSKRVKGISSPLITAHGKRIEPIIIKDPRPLGMQVADSASYITPEYAKLLKIQYGEFEDIGKNLKSLYYGQNMDNISFEEQMGAVRIPIYLKTHTHVLTKDAIKKHPNLQYIKDVLDYRAKLLNNNTIPIVYFDSSIKGGLVKTQKDKMSYSMEEIKNISDIINKNKPTGKLFSKKQDDLYKFTDEQGNASYGFDGESFGIQNTLDNVNKTSILSKQYASNTGVLNTIPYFEQLGMTGVTALGRVNELLGNIKLAQYEENFKNKNFEEIYTERAKDLYSWMDGRAVDELGSSYMGNIHFYNNIIASNFKKNVMQTRLPGTLSTEMTDIGFNYVVGKENTIEDETLKSYRVEDGKVQVAEIVISKTLATQNGVKVGDLVFAARIPNSKIGDGLVFRVKEILSNQEGNAVIIPSRHAALIGSDKDGDQLHIAVLNKKDESKLTQSEKLKNDLLNFLFELYQQTEMMELILQEVDFSSSITDKGLNHIKNNKLTEEERKEFEREKDDLSIMDEQDIQDRFIGNNVMLGIVASLNRAFNYFASGIGAQKNNQLKTQIRYQEGKPLNFTIVNSLGKVERLGYIENITDNNEKAWLSYAQFLNFIIDDGKFGNRAKFKMQEESANHFAFMMRMGLSLETVLDVMYDKTYLSYMKALGSGLTKSEALKSATQMSQIDRSTEGVTANYRVDLSDVGGFGNNLFAFSSLIVALDSFGKEMRTFQTMASLDSKMPTSYFEAYVLGEQFKEAMKNQISMASMFNRNSDLTSQLELFNIYKEQKLQESIISQADAKLIYDNLSKTLDFTKPENVRFVYDALQYNKMAVYMNPTALSTGNKSHKGGTFTDLLFNYSTISLEQTQQLEAKYSGRELLEEKLKVINDNAAQLIKDYGNNGFIQLLELKKSRKTFRKYEGNARVTVKYWNDIKLNRESYDSIRSEENLKQLRDEFSSLPDALQNYLISYEFFNNKLGTDGGSTMLMFMPSNVRNEVKRTSDFIANPKNKSKNNIRNEMIHANELIAGSDYIFADEKIKNAIDGDLNNNMLFLFRMTEILQAYSSKQLMNALNSFAFSNRMSEQTYIENKKDGTKVYHQMQSPVISKMSKQQAADLSKADKTGKYRGKDLFKIEWEVTREVNGVRSKPQKAYVPIIGDRHLNELNAILTYNGPLQANYKKLKENGTFYLHDQNASSFMFGQDSSYSLDEFAKEKGLIKWSSTVANLEEENYAKFNQIKSDYDGYLNSLDAVKELRDNLYRNPNIFRVVKDEEGKDIAFTKEQNLKFSKELPGRITEYYNQLTNEHPLAKDMLAKELQFMYGEAMSNEQMAYWGKTDAGARLLGKVSNDDRTSDITVGEMWLGVGDFGQNHPTLASARRNLERGNQLMHRDLKRMTDELNESYDALYKSKYGIGTRAVKFFSRMPVLSLLKSSEGVSDKLFENILFRQSKIKRRFEGGKEIIDYETKHELNKAIFYEDNRIRPNLHKFINSDGQRLYSDAEINYAGVISRYTQFYSALSKQKGLYTQDRNFYAPLADSSKMEILRKRGIYGLYYSYFGARGDINSIKVKGFNPLSNKEEVKTYGEFQAIYSASQEDVKVFAKENPGEKINIAHFKSINSIKQMESFKKKALGYLAKGIDIEGKKIIRQDGVNEVVTAESQSFNRYTSSRSHRAAYLASGNLQYAMYNYVKTMVFQHGTEFYDGYNYNRLEFQVPGKLSINKKKESKLLIGKNAHSKSTQDLSVRASKGTLSKEMAQKYAVPAFQGFDAYKFQIGAAMTYLKNSGALSANSVKYLQENMLESFILQKPKRTISPFPEVEKRVITSMVNLTMRVGLGLNFTAAIFNIAIGKYNAWRSQGTANFVKSHFRALGLSKIGSAFSFKNSRKTLLILQEFGILTYRPEEQLEGAKYETYLDKILFYPMVTAERFIQEVQFVGEMSDEQWNSYDLDAKGNLIVVDEKNILSVDDVARLQRRVQNMQGRGYSAVDQRLIQQYVIGSAALQFKRWFPTFLADRIGRGGYMDYIDDFGDIYTGTLKAFATEEDKVKLSKYINPLEYVRFALNPNLWNPSMKSNEEYIKDGLSKSQTEALQRLHRGMMGIVVVASLLLMSAGDDDESEKERTMLNKLLTDMLLMVNVEKVGKMIIMPAFSTFQNVAELVLAITTRTEYKRDSKYGRSGDKKWRRHAAALIPNIGIPGDDKANLKFAMFGSEQSGNEQKRKRNRMRKRRKEKFGRS